MKTKRKSFLVEESGFCKKVYISKEYCCVYIQNTSIHDIEISKVGDDVCIQNLSRDLPCQKKVKKIEK